MSGTYPSLVLASQSVARRRLLDQAGLIFSTQNARVDEDSLREGMLAENATPAHMAEVLAEMKAVKVSRAEPNALVIGADQILACDGEVFTKASDRAGQVAQLTALAGKSHTLHTSAVVAKGGQRIWHGAAAPRLTMRALSPDAIAAYLDRESENVFGCVGCYRIEGPGVQLFSAIEGSLFAVQGLPLVELLGFLRGHGVEGLIP